MAGQGRAGTISVLHKKDCCSPVPCIQRWRRTCQFSEPETPWRHHLLGLTLEVNSGIRDALKAGLPEVMVNMELQAQAEGNTSPLGNAGPLSLRIRGKSACCWACMDKCPANHSLRPSGQLSTELVWLSREFASLKSPASYGSSCEALGGPCLFLHTWKLAVPLQSSSQCPAFFSRTIPSSCLPKATFLGFSDLAARLIWPSVSRPVSRPIRRSGSLPKALDMVRLLWNMKSWECFAAAA